MRLNVTVSPIEPLSLPRALLRRNNQAALQAGRKRRPMAIH